ncbi:MAG: hypothetical protein CBC38_06095 [Gammaproteobacteria bacterium TMED78]|nr:MAG: hypothetical protein CBC38_06095 [Gammaproteobacteria bacterium TMED78]|tara:strand:+ start:29655 stop:30470 length:816 start_codon:yes stop_codon:yes gene_type:complete
MLKSIKKYLFLLSLTYLVSCGNQQNPTNTLSNDLVASVNNQPIETSLLEYYSLGRIQKDINSLSDEEYDVLVDELIQFKLLEEVAESQGYAQEQEVIAEIEVLRLNILSRIAITNYLESNQPTDAELQIAYNNNLSQLSGTEYKARHILVEEESLANEIIQEINGGADFETLAIERSTGPSGPNGGDLGWFSAQTMVAPFAEAVESMEIGSFTQSPVTTRFGYHVILLEDKREQQPPGLEAVRDDMVRMVEQQKIASYLEVLRESAEVTLE